MLLEVKSVIDSIPVYILFFVGTLVLQIVLSSIKRTKVLGFILPVLCGMFSILFSMNFMEKISNFLFVFLFINSATLLYIAIFVLCRKRINEKYGKERMIIQDLD